MNDWMGSRNHGDALGRAVRPTVGLGLGIDAAELHDVNLGGMGKTCVQGNRLAGLHHPRRAVACAHLFIKIGQGRHGSTSGKAMAPRSGWRARATLVTESQSATKAGLAPPSISTVTA